MIIEILLAALVFLFAIIGFFLWKFYKIIINFLPPGVLDSVPALTGEKTGVLSFPPPFVLSSWKYKLCLLKTYFDNGYSLTSYPKWALAIMGIGSAIKGYSLMWLFAGAFLYGFFCFVIGYVWLKLGFYLATQEVSNQFNLFVKEMRERKNI